ncbi:methyltransferase-like protein 27 [Haliotis rubra]|uniref:methyltransferase-like protein 27 n=1 Tax=Haliotis rubra TaxID=36100 RepID=UPI001EE53069|nr:methyltransferase-like protein 27 [Haliotis rubra]
MSDEGVTTNSQNYVQEDTARAFTAECHRVGITTEEVVDFYTKWAMNGKYDQDLRFEQYEGPVIAANAVAEYFRDDIPQTKVLDVAAGTGLVGEQLQDHGFKHLDALEPASGMLEQARKKNIYTKIYCEFLNSKPLPIDDGSYDCSVSCGGMGEGHIPLHGFYELIRVTKPGGLVCIVMKESYLSQCKEYKDGLEQLMKELEDAGKWERLSRDVVPKYAFGENGVMFRFRICNRN